MPKRISTARGRELGAGLRAALESAELTSRAAAAIVNWDESKLSDVVNGKGGTTQLEVALLLGVCRVKAAEVDHLLSLYPDRDVQGWWQQHGVCAPIWPRTVAEHLRLAKTLTSWHTHLVPVFLQTPEYMHEVVSASSTAPAGEVLERVQAQQAMQELLKCGVTRTFYIDELALHRKVGGAAVHARQMLHLLRMASLPNVTIRVMSAKRGAHAGLAGPFTRLTFEKYEPLVWTETENSSLFVEARAAVEGYEKVVRTLHETCLNESESATLIADLSGFERGSDV